MAIYKRTFALLFLLGTLAACDTQVNNGEAINHQEQQEEEIDEEVNEYGLVLNDGELWEANPETTEGIQNMLNMMNDFTLHDDTSAYAMLKEELHTEYKLIFKRCTMKGEAHNQLHNYLMPLKDKLNDLICQELETCRVNFDALNAHLTLYDTYFQ